MISRILSPITRAAFSTRTALRVSALSSLRSMTNARAASTTSAANAALREVVLEEIRHEEEEVDEDFPDIQEIKAEESPEGFEIVEEFSNALFHLVREPRMEDPESTEPSVRITVSRPRVGIAQCPGRSDTKSG